MNTCFSRDKRFINAVTPTMRYETDKIKVNKSAYASENWIPTGCVIGVMKIPRTDVYICENRLSMHYYLRTTFVNDSRASVGATLLEVTPEVYSEVRKHLNID